MTTTDTSDNAIHSQVLLGLMAAVQLADRLYAEGKYDEARAALRPFDTEGEHSFDHWEELFWQEIRERVMPTYDMRDVVLERVQKDCQAYSYGFYPTNLRWAGDGDQRYDRSQAEQIVNDLVHEGKLLYRQRLLWTPEAWEQHKARGAQRSKAAAAKRIIRI